MAIFSLRIRQTSTINTAAARSGHGLAIADLREQAMIGALAIGAVLVAMACAAVIGVIADEPFKVFTKEPVEQFAQSKPYAGILAHLTWFLWVAGGTAALLAAAVLHRLARPSDASDSC